MIKNIKYAGYTAQPSDYECQDGELTAALNLINEDGALRPLFPPGSLSANVPVDVHFYYIHDVASQRNYIIKKDLPDSDAAEIYWITQSDNFNLDGLLTSDRLLDAGGLAVKDIAGIGNTLVLATDDGLRYFLWEDGKYLSLGEKPPRLSLCFGLHSYKVNTALPYSTSIKGFYFHGSSGRQTPDGAAKSAYGNAVFAAVNGALALLNKYPLFSQPFFVRYAYRLYDGTHAWPSAPVLMLPSIMVPTVYYDYGGDATTLNYADDVETTFCCRLWASQLLYYSDPKVAADLQKWNNIIKGVDVFVTAPIYTFKQELRGHYRGGGTEWGNAEEVHNIGSGEDSPDKLFVGQGSTSNSTIISASSFGDIFISRTDSAPANVAPICIADLRNNLADANCFYKVAELDIEQLLNGDAETVRFKLLNLTIDNLAKINTQQQLLEDNLPLRHLFPSSLYAYNSRLNLAGVRIAPATPFDLHESTSFAGAAKNAEVIIKVWTRINGCKCVAVSENDARHVFYDISAQFPRFLYYPDASAYKMEIHFPALNQKYILDLKEHDFLDGAYYLCNNFTSALPPENASPETEECVTSVSVDSRIYTSEVNNPFLFRSQGAVQVGFGRVLATATAAKALSQGQFGQFPLYAFTDAGVWAMEVAPDGSYSTRQPITRDVCTNPAGITQIDSAVLFPTDRGIMLLSGSDCRCISDTINTDRPFNALSLPHMDELHSRLSAGYASDSCLPTLPFLQFLRDCRMIYDYVHRRIIVYNTTVTYAYVYSLKSQCWGMMHSNIADNINSYPNALAITADGSLVDFAIDPVASGRERQMLVSRPLKLDAADVLKTIDAVIHRGYFRKGHVQSVLYGSRDLVNWHLIWSSKDQYMRGFRGTPYKYFRIALLCSLSEDESIYGATMQYETRKTNQPR